ncbi:hypothetical protein, partial [Methylotenera sp.]|uniref:hypothetical protein n=1 Tax=Methylotenera sp. TaxID=2051956 RepID=UPI002489A7BC
QELNKIKRFEDAECTIVGFEELMHNDNEKVTNELGRSQRSTHAAGLVPMDTLGALKCLTDDGVPFNLGSGFDTEERAHIWKNRDSYLNTRYKYKFFPIGTDVAPRHPIALGPRSPLDV